MIEMAARGGGSRIASDIVPFMSGVDNYQLLINAALGKTPSVEELHISDAEKMKERAAVRISISNQRERRLPKLKVLSRLMQFRKFYSFNLNLKKAIL